MYPEERQQETWEGLRAQGEASIGAEQGPSSKWRERDGLGEDGHSGCCWLSLSVLQHWEWVGVSGATGGACPVSRVMC